MPIRVATATKKDIGPKNVPTTKEDVPEVQDPEVDHQQNKIIEFQK
tara:strand:- start:42 stop:179 length:138 start_codon:yes stop_codon:yes gene_type:complete